MVAAALHTNRKTAQVIIDDGMRLLLTGFHSPLRARS